MYNVTQEYLHVVLVCLHITQLYYMMFNSITQIYNVLSLHTCLAYSEKGDTNATTLMQYNKWSLRNQH